MDRKKPKLDERWIIKIENKDFVKYAGLLDLGHQKGISQIEVDPIQLADRRKRELRRMQGNCRFKDWGVLH